MTCSHPVVPLPHKCETDETLWVCEQCSQIVWAVPQEPEHLGVTKIEDKQLFPTRAGDTITHVTVGEGFDRVGVPYLPRLAVSGTSPVKVADDLFDAAFGRRPGGTKP